MLTEPKLTNTNKNFGRPAKTANPYLERLGELHVDSFNYILEDGLDKVARNMAPVELLLADGKKLSLWIEHVRIGKPTVPEKALGARNKCVLPTECRQRGSTYKGKCTMKIGWALNGVTQQVIEKVIGETPIMVKSKQCYLHEKTPAELIAMKEHEREWGGYFIVKGHERLIRTLTIQRRNYPIAIKRSSWKQRGDSFTDLGVLIRSVRDDNTTVTNTLHYLSNGTVRVMFSHRKMMYYLPLILVLKCLRDVPDVYIYEALTTGFKDDPCYQDCIKYMLRKVHEAGLHTQNQHKAHLGKMFRVKIFEVSADSSDIEFADYIIKHNILVHLDNPKDKFNFFIHSTQKLFALANNKCLVEGVDAVMMQEVLTGGHLYLQVLRERLYVYLTNIRMALIKRGRTVGANFAINSQEIMNAAKKAGSLDSYMEHFIATGTIKTQNDLGIQQTVGLSIVAENINRQRYMSHFRAIHRGSFSKEMRTTEVRQLLPDAWGFICPVHTPDGAPCGILNHLALDCTITKRPEESLRREIPSILAELGVLPGYLVKHVSYSVMLDGRMMGFLDEKSAPKVAKELRRMKIAEQIPPTTEIVLIPRMPVNGQYPGLFLFTGPSRMMRPVVNLEFQKTELVGTFEQIYLNVAVSKSEIVEGVTTHLELGETSFLSNLAQLIPLPDHNQSPRNMYQCQMAKQTMGTPCHTWQIQSDTKLFRLQTPATPLFRPVHHDNIALDEFAMGTNAIIAVISYTGYDMEDAMIINKSASERGFAHASIYKTEFVDLPDAHSYFQRDPASLNVSSSIASNGLPRPGSLLHAGEVMCMYYNALESRFASKNFKGPEDAYVDTVKLCSDFAATTPPRACITYRIPRNPCVGDKFASRAGQKGICSQKLPAEDLPFTDSGMIPDIVFNPHGFPSRMTIAMMIEVMAGKSAAINGEVHDATPFKFDEGNTAYDYFGRKLKEAGYDYYGREQLYSGVSGQAMSTDIYFGVVHYQRLRHMVSDKWQVRSTGPTDLRTGQPIKGRSKGGGIRFGEMERDSLISHGCSFLLQDRLLNCSDKITTVVCTTCGTLCGPEMEWSNAHYYKKFTCRLCKEKGSVHKIDFPYIWKYLVTELLSCNINVKMSFNHR